MSNYEIIIYYGYKIEDKEIREMFEGDAEREYEDEIRMYDEEDRYLIKKYIEKKMKEKDYDSEIEVIYLTGQSVT